MSHRMSKHRLYQTWNMMKQRCNNKFSTSYKNYGAKGISVCKEWMDISKFIEDMYPTFSEGLTLDRIDTNGDYCKENCKWSNKNEQQQNTRVLKSTNTSGFRGIYFHKPSGKWQSSIRVNKVKISLGYFFTKEEAAKAYDKYIDENYLHHTKNNI